MEYNLYKFTKLPGLRTYSHVKFYESPARQAEKLVEKVEEVNEDDQDVEEIVIDTESDQFEYLQMLELERGKRCVIFLNGIILILIIKLY